MLSEGNGVFLTSFYYLTQRRFSSCLFISEGNCVFLALFYYLTERRLTSLLYLSKVNGVFFPFFYYLTQQHFYSLLFLFNANSIRFIDSEIRIPCRKLQINADNKKDSNKKKICGKYFSVCDNFDFLLCLCRNFYGKTMIC